MHRSGMAPILLFRSETRTRRGDITQFGGKIHSYNPQKVGTEFRSACCELPDMPQVPLCESCGTASHYGDAQQLPRQGGLGEIV